MNLSREQFIIAQSQPEENTCTNLVTKRSPMSKQNLGDLLAEVLPKDVKLNVRHISTPPTRSEALFSAPPGEDPETTFCEDHFLLITINRNGNIEEEIAVFGIEVLIYTTDRLTTLFVSKADSTGYLHLLHVSPKTSLLRLISTAFLSYLERTHQRPGVRLVLSLFARAQNQYLFPGSVDNAGKHILDDRGLIKWWCRAADPILREYALESQESEKKGLLDEAVEIGKSSATAYLLVPGCDRYETRAFFPDTAKSDDRDHARWRSSYPLHQICGHPEAPPRCLIPRFPDDPKARFLIDLDDELPEVSETDGASTQGSGQWRSVKSLDQFWEMMAFRQECSAGRLVGFLWLVINPPGLLNTDDLPIQRQMARTSQTDDANVSQGPPEEVLPSNLPAESPPQTARNQSSQHEGFSSSGDPRSHIKTDNNPFFWPEGGRGEIILDDSTYKSAIDFLLEQDFDDEEVSVSSTMDWVRKVASLADLLWWGQPVTGKREISEETPNIPATNNLMASGLIVRKRKKEDQESANGTSPETDEVKASAAEQDREDETRSRQMSQADKSPETSTAGVNVLNASFIRRKKKT
jgi:regulator of Ty1 transposition protein 109